MNNFTGYSVSNKHFFLITPIKKDTFSKIDFIFQFLSSKTTEFRIKREYIRVPNNLESHGI